MSRGQHHDPVQRLNDHHADDLLVAARVLGGYPDATSARADHVDPDGIDLVLETPRGPATARVGFTESLADADPNLLRAAFRDLTRRARAALAADSSESSSP